MGGRCCMSGWVKYVGEVVRVGDVVSLGMLGMLVWAVLCAGAGEWAVLYVLVGEGDWHGGKSGWCFVSG